MRRRLDESGEKVLAEWLGHYKPPEETRGLIAGALRAFAEDENQLSFQMTEDATNPGETVIAPRDDLLMHVRVLGPAMFTLVRIIEGAGYLPAGDD